MEQLQQGRELRRLVASLDEARGRREARAWKAEGTKCVTDLLGYFHCRVLMATSQWLDENDIAGRAVSNVVTVPPRELERMSRLQSAPPVIGVFDMPEPDMPPLDSRELIVALDTVQDPGNLGTIIRTADWMGVRAIIANRSTADCFGPKVVMATMGALARVGVHYVDSLEAELAMRREAGSRIIGTFLDGDSLYGATLPCHGDGCVLVMGNEGRGISPEVEKQVTDRVLIPPYPQGATTSESLNVATATAITLAHLRFGTEKQHI
ncbi:MAG: RNA methyltransferase [Bacteroides sp.]|nr:RNA methyltransferase [Bacteroides sp.]